MSIMCAFHRRVIRTVIHLSSDFVPDNWDCHIYNFLLLCHNVSLFSRCQRSQSTSCPFSRNVTTFSSLPLRPVIIIRSPKCCFNFSFRYFFSYPLSASRKDAITSVSSFREYWHSSLSSKYTHSFWKASALVTSGGLPFCEDSLVWRPAQKRSAHSWWYFASAATRSVSVWIRSSTSFPHSSFLSLAHLMMLSMAGRVSTPL